MCSVKCCISVPMSEQVPTLLWFGETSCWINHSCSRRSPEWAQRQTQGTSHLPVSCQVFVLSHDMKPCSWSPLFAEMVRTATPFPMVSLLFVFTAFVISNIGHIRPQRTILAFVSGIFFILSGKEDESLTHLTVILSKNNLNTQI